MFKEQGTTNLPVRIDGGCLGFPVAQFVQRLWQSLTFFNDRMDHEPGSEVEPTGPGDIVACESTEVHKLHTDIRQGHEVIQGVILGGLPEAKEVDDMEDTQFDVQIPGQRGSDLVKRNESTEVWCG